MVYEQMTGHLALLAGWREDGRPAHEVVPAQLQSDGLWLLLATPALAEGCAEGDVLAVTEAGEYAVAARGGNVAVVSYAPEGATLLPHVEVLRGLLGPRAKVEACTDGRWLVATIPIAVGFPAIEEAMATWATTCSTGWSYGNVYGENDEPLNWW